MLGQRTGEIPGAPSPTNLANVPDLSITTQGGKRTGEQDGPRPGSTTVPNYGTVPGYGTRTNEIPGTV